ncbi:MAG: hypothetical protein OEZ02_11345 [Anaerolineae bacterium]|nr:hypothetical protein [Anaerolineae bacterium]
MGTQDELKARVRLADGRQAWRDGQGRYRDANTGRWIAKDEVARVGLAAQPAAVLPDAPEETAAAEGLQAAQARARQHLLQAVVQEGHPAESPADAWGKLVGVQAEIALDKEMGSKATAAAKLVAAATGMLPDGRRGEDAALGEGIQLNISAEAASRLLDLISGERIVRLPPGDEAS